MKKPLILLLLLLGLQGCISPPPRLEKEQFALQSLKAIQINDYACRCKKARLGGKVITATALKDKTKVEVLSLPIAGFSAKPVLESVSDGRFMAYLPGFVDPDTLKDEYITVGGILTGKETGQIDLADYQYPVIMASAYKQWRRVQEYYYDPNDWNDYWYERRFGFGFYWLRPELRLRYTLY